MIKERFAREVDRAIVRFTPLVTRIPLTPDQLTLAGVGFSVLAALAYTQNAVVLGGILLIPAGIGDLIDGVVARARGQATRAGAFFDSTMDRLSDLLVLGGMAVGMAAQQDPWGAALVCWALAGSVMTSYVRARAEVELESFSIGWMERAERFVVLLVASLANQLVIGLWVVAIGSTATSIQRIRKAREWIGDRERRASSDLAPAPASGESGPTDATPPADAPATGDANVQPAPTPLPSREGRTEEGGGRPS